MNPFGQLSQMQRCGGDDRKGNERKGEVGVVFEQYLK